MWSTLCALPSPHSACACVCESGQRNICAYAVVIVVKMAEGETEKEYDTRRALEELRERFQGLTAALKEGSRSPLEASLRFCQEFCQVSAALSPLLIPGSPAAPLASWPRMRVYVSCYNNVASAASCPASFFFFSSSSLLWRFDVGRGGRMK